MKSGEEKSIESNSKELIEFINSCISGNKICGSNKKDGFSIVTENEEWAASSGIRVLGVGGFESSDIKKPYVYCEVCKQMEPFKIVSDVSRGERIIKIQSTYMTSVIINTLCLGCEKNFIQYVFSFKAIQVNEGKGKINKISGQYAACTNIYSKIKNFDCYEKRVYKTAFEKLGISKEDQEVLESILKIFYSMYMVDVDATPVCFPLLRTFFEKLFSFCTKVNLQNENGRFGEVIDKKFNEWINSHLSINDKFKFESLYGDLSKGVHNYSDDLTELTRLFLYIKNFLKNIETNGIVT